MFVTGEFDFLVGQEVVSRLGAERKLVYLLKSFDDFFARSGELDVCLGKQCAS